MKMYSAQGFSEFVVCLGYKGDFIKDYFLTYRSRQGSFSVNLSSGGVRPHTTEASEDWLVHLLETGNSTMTGGRVKKAAEFIGGRRFMLTYGDGVSDVDLQAVLAFHEQQGKLATLTAVRPPSRFGGLVIQNDAVLKFDEKPNSGESWINGGFMILEPDIIDYIEDDSTILERGPLERLAREGQLGVYKHSGYWQCMDTLRDKEHLEELWAADAAPWRRW